MSPAHSTRRGVVLALLVSVLTTAAGTPPVAYAGEALIVLTHRADPATVRVVAGDTVRFRNDDDERHRMRAREPESVDTSDIAPGAEVAVALDVPGTYTFVDERTEDPAYEVVVTVRDRSTTDTDAPAGPSGGPPADGPSTGEPTSASPSRRTTPTSATVTIPDRRFSPATITIAAGGTVTWENHDDDHTVTADDGGFDSGVFDAGGRFERTFRAAGEYAYHCVLHPEMTGVVSVTGAAGSSPTTPGTAPSRDDTPDTTARGADDAASEQGPASATPAAGRTGIAIQDFEFSPATSRVPVGTTVTWTNRGEAPHTVTSRGSGPLDSGLIAAGATFASTFREAGTYDYLCEFHPGMTARVVAVAGAGEPAAGDGAPPSGSPTAAGSASDTGRPVAPEAGATDPGTPGTSTSGAPARDGADVRAVATADGRHAAGITFVAALVAAFAAGRASATGRTAPSSPRRSR